ncbi:NmrA family transcriptional regulator [Niastella caeni]|uniref:NmrA family transcriptional regulator n=1 Tax=Niastella caeni TaxID=2569763 RepID=A0A4S8HHB3_9BACT|nr:NAD(P)H-binding protein [Niastella caeni]THU32974.1 NmrA family transcriptional regulator [Niastella caeni]
MSNTTTEHKQILVTGSTGKTGRRVLQRLLDRGIPVRGVSGSGNPRFDWNDPATWEKALNNIRYVYISYYPDLAVPGTGKVMEAFTKMAVEKGVQKLVLLSGRGEEEAQVCEKVVMNTGVDWSIVRASWFCQNFSEGSWLEPILAGHMPLPVGDIGEPFIDADDIADVAVAALTDEKHNKKLYEVTGPRLLTFEEAIKEIARATGRKITFERVPIDAYSAILADYGLPKDVIWLVTYLFTEVLDGRNESIADGVQQALGRKPNDFSEFARKTAASGVWAQ